jgi:hypothetical protein
MLTCGFVRWYVLKNELMPAGLFFTAEPHKFKKRFKRRE